MNANTTRLIAGLSLFAALNLGAVVKQVATGIQERANKAELIAAIEATGTTVTEKTCDGSYLGSYTVEWEGERITKDELALCMDAIGDNEALYMETLKHEAVHVAQMCTETGLVTGKGMTQLARTVSEAYDVKALLADYDEAHHHLELEAYALESEPTPHVTALVEMACS